MYRWISGFLLILFCHKMKKTTQLTFVSFFNFAYLLFNWKYLTLKKFKSNLKVQTKKTFIYETKPL